MTVIKHWDYFDIETAPLEEFKDESKRFGSKWGGIRDPNKTKIITIQYQSLEYDTGKPVDDITILKEWEESEESIIKNFVEVIDPSDKWLWNPVGNNFSFEWSHIIPKIKKYCDIEFDILQQVRILDLKGIAMLINGGELKGYSKIFNKKNLAVNMEDWYYNKEYDKIIDYIKNETDDFTDAFQKIFSHCKNYKNSN